MNTRVCTEDQALTFARSRRLKPWRRLWWWQRRRRFNLRPIVKSLVRTESHLSFALAFVSFALVIVAIKAVISRAIARRIALKLSATIATKQVT